MAARWRLGGHGGNGGRARALRQLERAPSAAAAVHTSGGTRLGRRSGHPGGGRAADDMGQPRPHADPLKKKNSNEFVQQASTDDEKWKIPRLLLLFF
jgi:hypothetical protein